MARTTRDLLLALVDAFGDAEAVCALLTEDAEWWITPTVGVLGSPSRGRAAINTSMQVIFGQMYGGVRTDVEHAISEGDVGAARFTMYAAALFAEGKPYENSYSVWIERRGDAIARVWEYLDVAHAAQQVGL